MEYEYNGTWKSKQMQDLIVTPRSCSSARVSVKRASPAAFFVIIPPRGVSNEEHPFTRCPTVKKLRENLI